MTEFTEYANAVRADDAKREPRTVEEWMQRINAQFDAIDAMVTDSKAVLRKWNEQRQRETEAPAAPVQP